VRYQRVPQSDLEVSAICLGTADFGGAVDALTAFGVLDRFVAQGGNFLDTARFYGSWHDDIDKTSEAVIGKWLKARGNRSGVVIGTKGGHPQYRPNFHLQPLIHRLSAEEIVADLERSLERLGTDFIDLYWLHYDDPDRPVDEIVDTLDAQVRRGVIRHFACCNWPTHRMREAQAWSKAQGKRGFVASQVLWNLAAHNPQALWVDGMQSMNNEMRAFHRETGIVSMPYSAQAGGIFSKASRPDFLQDPASAWLRTCYLNPETNHRIARVARFAQEAGAEPTQIALACLLNQPFITVPIVGPKNEMQLSASLDALRIKLDSADLAFLAGR
jgi:aryl-alcohol dehydrogenase-like predicted oxidoreductase